MVELILPTLAFAALSEPVITAQIENRHPRLLAARNEIEGARARLKSKRGAFDPVFTLDSVRYRYNASSSRGKVYETDMTEAMIELPTRSGATVFAGSRYNFGNVKSPNSSTGSMGEYFLGLKLPLLRRNGLNEKSVAEFQARIGLDIADQDLALIRLGTVRNGLVAYWRWIAAQEKLQITERLRDLARTRATQIGRRVALDDLPAIELTEVETEVRRRDGDVIRAERAVQAAANALSLFLWSDATIATLPKIGARLPVPSTVSEEEVTRWEQRALGQRPELKAIELSARATKLALDHARKDREPTLDVVLSPGTDLGRDSIGTTAKAGIFYSIPLRQNTVDGRIEEANAKLDRIGQDRRYLEGQIRVDIRDAANAVDAVYRRHLVVQGEVELAERLERGERIRYESGDGTLFLLIQRERTTAEARARLIDVLADYQDARLALLAAAAEL